MQRPTAALSGFCQSQLGTSPTFTHERTGGKEHTPVWKATCKVDGQTWTVTGVSGSSRDARDLVASRALACLQISRTKEGEEKEQPPTLRLLAKKKHSDVYGVTGVKGTVKVTGELRRLVRQGALELQFEQ